VPLGKNQTWDEFWAEDRAKRGGTAVKATPFTGGSGPGAFALDFYPSINAFQRDPNRMMNEALRLFRTNPWVAIAERTISWRFARVPWHLEDSDGNTIAEDTQGVSKEELAVQQLFEKPSKNQTRSQLWRLTCRHLGLLGNAFWMPDQANLFGSPLETLYINPVRMTPRIDAAGNLLGWVVDGPDNPVTGKAGNPGLPLEREEVIHLTLDEPDFGVWGIGIAEAAQTKIELDRLATRHEAQVFASGGRLTGIVAPKANSNIAVSDDQWRSMIKEWRNVTSDPESAKRLIISKGPIDFIETSSNNQQLQLVELSGQGRDDILNAWGVPVSQIGISKTVGLNSGETKAADEAIMWQNTISPRIEAFREKVQYELLDRIAANGPSLNLVIEQPEFDDKTPLFDLAAKSATVAMSWDERREIISLDPLDPEVYGALGQAISVDQSMVSLFDTAPAVPEPTPLLVPPVPPLAEADQPEISVVPAKAELEPKVFLGQRSRLQPAWERKVRAVVSAHLTAQRSMVSDNVRQRYAQLVKKPTDRQAWWNAKRWDSALQAALEPVLADYAATVGRRTTVTLKRATKAEGDWLSALVKIIRNDVGSRIGDINDTTRDRVQQLVEQGVKDGLGPSALGDLIEEDGIFDAARSELIARTETALVYNAAALGSYREFGVERVEALDGDKDDECASRNHEIFSVEEASGIQDHPNGTLDWVPIVPEVVAVKAELEDDMDDGLIKIRLPKPADIHVDVAAPPPQPPPQVTVNVPQQLPPSVNVTVPEQKMPTPIVNVAAAKATLPAQVEIVSMPNRKHVAVRDEEGIIQGSVESDA
jgi:HK97 family phage portal protein